MTNKGPLSPEVTDVHRVAARELLRDILDLPIRPPAEKMIERLAQRLAMLEHHARTVAVTERRMVGNTDRWILISSTSPSGKALFVCRSCGGLSPSPLKTCAKPVRLWNGAMRECADWEPPKDDRVG